jgi:hypothetical protein
MTLTLGQTIRSSLLSSDETIMRPLGAFDPWGKLTSQHASLPKMRCCFESTKRSDTGPVSRFRILLPDIFCEVINNRARML